MWDTWGTTCQRLREVLKCSQVKLAECLGVDQGTISRWERGAVVPSLLNRQKIIKILTETHSDTKHTEINDLRDEPGWVLVTDAEFRYVTASLRVRETFGDYKEGDSLWGQLGPGADMIAHENKALGMPLGLIEKRTYCIKNAGNWWAICDHPITTKNGEILTCTRAEIITEERAKYLKAIGWDGRIVPAKLKTP